MAAVVITRLVRVKLMRMLKRLSQMETEQYGLESHGSRRRMLATRVVFVAGLLACRLSNSCDDTYETHGAQKP